MAQRPVSLVQAALGLTLFATIALPMSPGGPSLLDLLVHIARDNPLGAVIILVMFGCPQMFGLAVAIAGVAREDEAVRGGVTWFVAILQGMIVLMGFNLLGAPVVAPVALTGFALVTGLYLPYAVGQAEAASGARLSLRWFVRWGALLVAGLGLWLRLQALGGAPIGPAVDVAIGAAVLLLTSLARREPPVPGE